jgi:ankyrin repeat protein
LTNFSSSLSSFAYIFSEQQRSVVFLLFSLSPLLLILALAMLFMMIHAYKWFFSHFLILAPPPNILPVPRSLEKSNFPAPKSQDLVKFRKEIEQNNMAKVYDLIMSNPRYLVSSGDTPSILKEGPRYNALHIAAMHNHARMVKLILQTVEQTQFIEHLHGFTNDPNIEVMCQNLLESYLNTPDKSRNETPLHFAAKIGALEVIEVLISYPLCKMKPNFEGLYPKDVSFNARVY